MIEKQDRQPGHILKVDNLSFSYGGVRAVANVSLAVPTGAIVGLIGPNGAGKSTLIDCLSGVLQNYRGDVHFDGIKTTGWPSHRVASVGLVRTFQTSRLFSRLTAMSNLLMGAQRQVGEDLLGAWFKRWKPHQTPHIQRAFDLSDRYDLTKVRDHYGAELSGGQRKLTELARSLMASPKMLLLDEPFAGVSPVMRDRLTQQLLALRNDTGVTLLMVEHRLDLVEAVCDYVFVMAGGQLLAQGRMAELRSNQAVLDAYLGTAIH